MPMHGYELQHKYESSEKYVMLQSIFLHDCNATGP